jgi:head-tail adaptor
VPWPAIDPGRMVHRITILRQVASSDISGTTNVWSPLVTTWAAIDPVKGTDQIAGGQVTTQLLLTVTMYWQRGIASNMRVKTINSTYVIQSLENPGERNLLLVLNCVALKGNQ